MENKLLLNDEELDLIAGGGYKPGDVGSSVGQYDVQPGKEYYLHYTSGGHDEWIKIKVEKVYEKPNGYFFWHQCTIRTADIIVCMTGAKDSIPINKKNTIFEINR